ncbi:adenylate/guanylate cyclase domain-containing protein [Ruegeria atlantica]|uniref:Invasion protein regulator n=1 Tax=Ruegeria atlantica TaxID=81569 RepID=A0A0P1E129_9RHOB|nr:adenylate/guanylate cyclase domain-containing protein [Ruegeria atlantica]CUH41555.1 invasion protein regulator [Ruegeria atlantica]
MERRLATILAADVVGYSRLMEADEQGTLSALREARIVIDKLIEDHNGRIFNSAGDSLVAEFRSPVQGMSCAVKMQSHFSELRSGTRTEPALQLRVGVNLGDVSTDGNNLLGTGVNIAARLEQIADPGGICLSQTVYEHLGGVLNLHFVDMGEQNLKNIVRQVHTWSWRPEGQLASESEHELPNESFAKPCIAVLPFNNMSGDPEQEYFSDGLTEDIITALAKHRWLDVVARNTTFSYKNASPNIREVGQELGAEYVLEGSVRRAGQRVRVTGQLIDAGTGAHIWADRYDRSLEDIFDLQDEMTQNIVGRIEPEIGLAIRQKIVKKAHPEVRAWDAYHLGLAKFYQFTPEANKEAQSLLQQARDLDPDFAEAHGMWAYAMILGMVYWDTEPDPYLMDEALAATRQAVALDSQNALLYMLMGRVQLARREYRAALAENEKAIELNPTLAPAYCALGDSLAYEGRYEEASEHFQKSVEMSPNHPQLWAFLTYGALNFLFAHQFERALDWAERAADIPNCQYWALSHAVVALSYLDRKDEARKVVDRLLRERPDFSLKFAQKRLFYLKREDQLKLYLEGLEAAGIQD